METAPLMVSLLFSVLLLLLHLVYQFGTIQNEYFVKAMRAIVDTGLFSFFYKPHLLALAFAGIYAFGIRGMKSESISSSSTLLHLVFGNMLYFGAYFTLLLPIDVAMYAYTGLLFTGYLLALR